MKHRNMRLQFFAESAGAGEGGNGTEQNPAAGTPPTGQGTAAIDYAKIQQMLDGTLAAKEDTALKAYFKQQGMTEEEMKQAISSFKEQRAAAQPDVNALQQQLIQAQSGMQRALLEKEATMTAVSLGVDAKMIPYVLKMADINQSIGQDGKVDNEKLKNAINKVLEDVPALKPQAAATGFVQVGAPGSAAQAAGDEALKKAFGL